MRAAVEVRHAGAEELAQVAALCLEARQEAMTGSQVCGRDADRLKRQLSVIQALPDAHILVACHDNQVVGFTVARVVSPHVFSVEPGVYLEALYVGSKARRRGTGHALLAAIAELADSSGAPDVYAVPIPGSRGVQRFLARMGFAPVAGHRWVPTATLQRRLIGDPGVAHRRGRSVEKLIARRRRTRENPVELLETQEILQTERAPAESEARYQDPVSHERSTDRLTLVPK